MERDGGDYTRLQPFAWTGVPHYHGDAVRQLFIGGAVLMLVGAPFYAETLRTELPFEIVGALVLAALAALTNPHNKLTMLANAVAAGVGLLIYETWALNQYSDSTWTQFVLREILALIFLIAFYFSMKTVRAFLLHQVGKREAVDEFDEEPAQDGPPPEREERGRPNNDDFNPWAPRNHGPKERSKGAGLEGPRMSPGRSREETEPKSHPYEERI